MKCTLFDQTTPLREALKDKRQYRAFPLPTKLELALVECFGYDGRPPTPAEKRALEKAGYIRCVLTPEGARARKRLTR